MEIWELYFEDGSPANVYIQRGEEIPKGLYHMVGEVLVRHVDGSYLVVKRDYNKSSHPGKYEASAGGSKLKGETIEEAARRELFEETGIVAGELQAIYVWNNGKSSIFHKYLCITDSSKDSVVLQEGETIAYKWLSEEDFLDFFYSDDFIESHRERMGEFISSLEEYK